MQPVASSSHGWRSLGVFAFALVGGCAAPSPELGTPVPEPTEALRPEAVRGPIPASSRVVDYVIDARYDEPQHRIEGRARVVWRNRGSAPVDHIPFHLYMNGFRATDTAWMAQAGGSHRANQQDPDHPWGFVDVGAVERLGGEGPDGEPARTALRFAEHDEPSLMTVWLDAPVAPGQSVELELSFVTQLPGVFARTGFAGRYVMAGQWFPKPGVLHPDGRWRAHPFTLYSEFYADFGDYEVTLDVPGDLVVGASGILVSTTVEDTRQRLHYRAQMVHDFAWTAGPDLVEAWDEYDGIRIRALLPSDRAGDAAAHLASQRAALRSMEARFGPYPWSTITFIDPPDDATGAGGMEYPTFYTTSHILSVPPVVRALGFETRLTGMFTTVHEFGHQYFQGLLASNEFSQPWLDEGLNTFSNALVYLDEYGEDGGDAPWILRVAGHPLTFDDGTRLQYAAAGPLQPIDQSADRFNPRLGTYGPLTYGKTAAVMGTLRRLAGPERFDAAMRTYAERFRFAHPTGADLEATLAEGLGEAIALGRTADGRPIELGLSSYFDQALRSTRTMDFRVHQVVNEARRPDAGWRRDADGTLVGGEQPLAEPPRDATDEQTEAVVVVVRSGEFVIPVSIEVEFADGTRERVLWDGTGRYRVLRWPGRRVRRATIDPDRDLLLEHHRYDNTRYARGDDPPLTVPDTMGRLTEALALALGGAFGP